MQRKRDRPLSMISTSGAHKTLRTGVDDIEEDEGNDEPENEDQESASDNEIFENAMTALAENQVQTSFRSKCKSVTASVYKRFSRLVAM